MTWGKDTRNCDSCQYVFLIYRQKSAKQTHRFGHYVHKSWTKWKFVFRTSTWWVTPSHAFEGAAFSIGLRSNSVELLQQPDIPLRERAGSSPVGRTTTFVWLYSTNRAILYTFLETFQKIKFLHAGVHRGDINSYFSADFMNRWTPIAVQFFHHNPVNLLLQSQNFFLQSQTVGVEDWLPQRPLLL